MKKNHIERYIDYLENVRGASPHTIRNYSIDLTSLYAFLNNRECSKELLREYLGELHAGGKKKSSIARTLSAIKSFYSYLQKNKLREGNPTANLQTPKTVRKIPVILDIAEMKKFMETPDESTYLGLRDRAIIELFYSSGIRLSELVNLDKNNIYFSEGLIKVFGKGNKERVVPITKRCTITLKSYLEDTKRFQAFEKHLPEFDKKAVFLNRFGERITTRSIDRIFNTYQKRAEIVKKVTPHTLRHSIATHLLEKGMDLRSIQEMLGHTTIVTTTIYTQVSAKLKLAAYQSFHPLASEEVTDRL